MKLKLGAKRDINASSKEIDEIIDDSSASSSCVEEANMNPNCNPASASGSQHIIVTSPSDEITMMETDYSSISTSPSSSDVSGGNCEQRRHNNVSILRFFKLKDPGNSRVSSCGEVASTKDGSSGSVSSSSVEPHYRSETECTQSLDICEFSE